MRFQVLLASTVAMMSMAANAQGLSWQGVGPVRLGMTVAEAERALNAKLAPVALPFSKECYVTGRADGKDEALSYVIRNARIVVVTVFSRDYRQPDPDIADANGIGVGLAEADIRRGYQKVGKELAPDYRDSEAELAEQARERARHGDFSKPESPHYRIIAESPDHQRAIIFETRDEKVLDLRIGLKPHVMSSEDCL
jgi:hypothetical protein